MQAAQLRCPIRGLLHARHHQSSAFSFSEEKRRIDCIRWLIQKGYPKEHIDLNPNLGGQSNGARDPMRADLAVYIQPVAAVRQYADVERRRKLVKILCEVRRDRASLRPGTSHPLRPAIELLPSVPAFGIYWDDFEQSLLVKEAQDSKILIREAAVAYLPSFGSPRVVREIHFGDVKPTADLVQRFARLDDILHQAGHPKDERYSILYKVLLVKIHDEHNARSNNGRMLIQDFTAKGNSDEAVRAIFQCGLKAALRAFGHVLPGRAEPDIGCSGAVLRQVSRIICPINILGSAPHVLQDFFMYFSRFLYKVDLGQYFTPYEVIDFIVRIVNPGPQDVVTDPACGTGDFLTAAKRIVEQTHGIDISGALHGTDVAEKAVTLSNFNMLLNGCERTNIVELGDSLERLARSEPFATLALCNPPFGTHILERRRNILAGFELGTRPADGGRVPLEAQETGLLFVEACLRAVKPGGRVGIILPNGYLGNRSPRYLGFRQWLLRHARIAAVIGFPRFTFKKSGADVSASAVILERRAQPLPDLSAADDHPIHFNLVEKVGWDLQSRQASRIFRRNERDGSLLLDEDNAPIVDADFDRVLDELRASEAARCFGWLAGGARKPGSRNGWSVRASEILARKDLCLDPKRWCAKHARVVAAIRSGAHLAIGEVLRPVERRLTNKRPEAVYRYVAIENIFESFGTYIAEDYAGWALPSRARLLAAPGDVFIANIWSSAGKWLIAGDDARDGRLVVTNGCHHFEVIPGQERLLPDLVFGLSSEAFRVQMRALATGSDGLATVALEDMMSIVLPRPTSESVRRSIARRIREARAGHLVLPRLVREELAASASPACVQPRSSHVVQV